MGAVGCRFLERTNAAERRAANRARVANGRDPRTRPPAPPTQAQRLHRKAGETRASNRNATKKRALADNRIARQYGWIDVKSTGEFGNVFPPVRDLKELR